MARKYKQYTDEFKRNALEMAARGEVSIAQFRLSRETRDLVEGKLFVNRVPCTECVFKNGTTNQRFEDLRGNIQSGIVNRLSELQLIFSRNQQDGFPQAFEDPIIIKP